MADRRLRKARKIIERTRRGKARRARQGSVNVLSGAPFVVTANWQERPCRRALRGARARGGGRGRTVPPLRRGRCRDRRADPVAHRHFLPLPASPM
jgi:hypothetical protein